MNRTQMIYGMSTQNKPYDFVITGGGATGIGILLEAVSRGYSAILFEAHDFTKSTSGKSTKLVHGGVRYLAQGDIALVREACLERGYLLKNAPHIVKNLPFIIPVYSAYDSMLYTIGLKFYDLLSGRFSLGKSQNIRPQAVMDAIPGLKSKNLRAGIKYFDCQFDDSRLALSGLQTAINMGGMAINYMEVTELQKDISGKLKGVNVKDTFTGEEYTIRGKNIVNATGVFADQIMEMDEPGHKKSIRPSQGIHVVVDKKFLPGNHALMIPKTADGRVLFAVPWLGKVVIGTTDTPIDDVSLEPKALKEEIEFILKTSAKYLTSAPEEKDILSIYAGLRPLAATNDKDKTREISRSHKIIVSKSGLLTLIGGKWTTFRKMAQDLINKTEKINHYNKTRSVSKNQKLFGANEDSIPGDNHSLYGSELENIKSLPGHQNLISTKLGITESMVIYAIRFEMAMKPEDILARRTRALLLDAKEAIRIAPEVTRIMASELEKNKEWIQKELHEFTILAKNYLPQNTE